MYDWGNDTQVYANAGLRGFYYGTRNRYAYAWVGGCFATLASPPGSR